MELTTEVQEAHTVEDARLRVSRWMQDAPSILELVAQVADDRQRALDAAEEASRECARLRGELAQARAQVDALERDRTETATMLAEALSRAGEALMRMRPPVPSADEIAPPAVPAAAPVVAIAPPVVAISEPVVERAADLEPIELPVGAEFGGDGAAGRRLLLVDDDASFRNVIVEYLEGIRGYDVRVATSGEEALETLERHTPDVVLLDLMMPGIGGMVALQRMKAQYPSLCVVMVTANEDLSLARKALSLGAADYVTKPFDLDYLDAVLNIYLAKGDPCSTTEPPAYASAAAGETRGPVATAARSLRSYFARR